MKPWDQEVIDCLRNYFQIGQDDGACFFLDSADPGYETGWLVVQVTKSGDAETLNDGFGCPIPERGEDAEDATRSEESKGEAEPASPTPTTVYLTGPIVNAEGVTPTPNSHAITLSATESKVEITKRESPTD